MGFAGGERSNNVGDSLDFEVSQQVALHSAASPILPQALRLPSLTLNTLHLYVFLSKYLLILCCMTCVALHRHNVCFLLFSYQLTKPHFLFSD